LERRIERAEKPRPVAFSQRGGATGILSQLAQVPGYLTTGKCIAYIRLRPSYSSRRDDTGAFLEAARGQWDVGRDAYIGGGDMIRDPIVGRVCAIADENHMHVRGPRRPDRSRAIVDNENVEPQARRYPIDLLPHWACIAIDINVSQLSTRFVPGVSLPVSHSFSFDHRRRARAPFTAIASAFRCPTSTTSRFPRVTPV
jgi:hypothetical protein